MDMNKIDSFHKSCLRSICSIFWPILVSNAEVYKITVCKSIVLEIKGKGLYWLGHTLKMSPECIPKKVLRWTTPGKRKPGHPNTTWWRTTVTELEEMGLTWGEALAVVQDQERGGVSLQPYAPLGEKKFS